jgi:hemolysin III
MTVYRSSPTLPSWNYDKAELVADGVLHVVGCVLALVGAVALFVISSSASSTWEQASLILYGVALLLMLGISGLYNMWPVSDLKWLLRRFDHSAIYVLIAATYTVLLAQVSTTVSVLLLVASVWVLAIIGILLKITFPGRFDRLSVLLYLLMGWCGVVVYEPVIRDLPAPTLYLLATGGILYTAGVLFHLWDGLRFQNAIWHAFVLAGIASHYFAVVETLNL